MFNIKEIARNFEYRIETANNIIIMAHTNPDGDAIRILYCYKKLSR